MVKKQVRFREQNVERLGTKGTCTDDLDSAFEKLLNLDDDIKRVLMFDEEPQTEELKLIKRKWTKR